MSGKESFRSFVRSRSGAGDRWWIWLLSLLLFGASLAIGSRAGERLRAGAGRLSAQSSRSLAGDESDLVRVRDIRLSLPENDWNFLFARPPLSLTAFQPAQMMVSDSLSPRKVQLRIRGGHAWHWRPDKPSLRVRMPRKHLFEGRQVLDLINPEDPAMLANLLADFLAARAGVAASITRLARVWLNDRYLGVYHLTDRLDGELLKRLDLSECPVAEGNRRATDLWLDPGLWDVHGGTMASRDQCRPALTRLLALTRPPLTTARMASLSAQMDLVRTASWSAVMTIIGSLQADDVHNQHWAYQTAEARFWPVVSDSTGFGALTRIGLVSCPEDIELWPYEYLFPFIDAAFRNPFFLARRNRAIWQLLQGELHPSRIASLALALHTLVAEDITRDLHRGGLINIPDLGVPIRVPISSATVASEVRQIGHWINHRGRYLTGVLASLSVTIFTLPPGAAPWQPVHITVWGHAPVEWELGDLATAVRLDRNQDQIVEADDATCPSRLRLYPAVQEEPPNGRKWLRGDRRLLPYLLAPASQTYLLGVDASRSAEVFARLQTTGRNAVTGEPASVHLETGMAAPSLYAHSQSLHPWTIPPGDLDW